MGLFVCLSEILNNHFIIVIIVLSYIVLFEFIHPINWSNKLKKIGLISFFWVKKTNASFTNINRSSWLFGSDQCSFFFLEIWATKIVLTSCIRLFVALFLYTLFIVISVKLWINVIIWGQKTYLLYKISLSYTQTHTCFSYEHMNYGRRDAEKTEWEKMNYEGMR